MKRLLLALAVLGAATLLAADKPAEKQKADHDLIQGTWKIVSVQSASDTGGKVLKAHPFFHGIRFTADTMWMLGKDDKGHDAATGPILYKLDASRRPKTMDTSHELDKDKPIVQRAIYALDGDELKLSLASAGAPYPTSLESNKKGDDWMSFVLKRVKKDEK